MDDLALDRRHRLERHGLAGADGVGGGPRGDVAQRPLAARPVALGVDDDLDRRLLVPVHDGVRQVLHGVDRVAVAADQEAQVVARHRRRHAVVATRRPST